jgi:uncharacterized protein (TIGR02996 family)
MPGAGVAPFRRDRTGVAPQHLGVLSGDELMSETLSRTAFLEAIKGEPDNDTPRLVFADWLEENGDPERADFIRIQCELDPLDEDDLRWANLWDREEELLQRHGDAWLGPLRGVVWPWRFKRGLLQVGVSGRPALEGLKALAGSEALDWVEALTVRLLEEDGDAGLASCRLLTGLVSLQLTGTRLAPEGARALASSPYLARLASLSLPHNDIGDEGARALALSPHLARLTSLGLWHNFIGADGTLALASSPYLARLAFLYLPQNEIGDAGARALAASPHLAHLAFLDLRDTRIGPEGAQALASSPHFARLASLNLQDNDIGDEAADALRQRFGEAVWM